MSGGGIVLLVLGVAAVGGVIWYVSTKSSQQAAATGALSAQLTAAGVGQAKATGWEDVALGATTGLFGAMGKIFGSDDSKSA